MDDKFATEIYDRDGNLLLSGDASVIKNNRLMYDYDGLPLIQNGTHVAVFIRIKGTNVEKYIGVVENSVESLCVIRLIQRSDSVARKPAGRINVDIMTKLEHFYSDENCFPVKHLISLNIRNISLGGIFFASNMALGIGQVVGFNIKCPQGDIYLKVRIKRIQKVKNYHMGYGGQIVNLSCRETLQLRDLIVALRTAGSRGRDKSSDR